MSEMAAKVKRIKLLSKRIMRSTLSGDYTSAFKGSGLEFDQIREYQPGDDVRSIDWNSFAKKHKLMIKQFVEERDRTVLLVLDISASLFTSSSRDLKKDFLESIALTLVFVAEQAKDKVGLLLFSDCIELWIPPARGKGHSARVIDAIMTAKPQDKRTDFLKPLHFLAKLKKRNAIVLMLSDWVSQDERYLKLFPVVRSMYDFVGIRCADRRDRDFPEVGFIDLFDPEEGCTVTVRTGKSLSSFLKNRLDVQRKNFEKNKIGLIDLVNGESFIPPLIRFFHERTKKQV